MYHVGKGWGGKGRNAHTNSVQDATLRQQVARAAVGGCSPDYTMLRSRPSFSGQTVLVVGTSRGMYTYVQIFTSCWSLFREGMNQFLRFAYNSNHL